VSKPTVKSLVKKTDFTCIVIYTTVKVVIAYSIYAIGLKVCFCRGLYMYTVVCIVRMYFLPLIFKIRSVQRRRSQPLFELSTSSEAYFLTTVFL
jgi:hypothetical protein